MTLKRTLAVAAGLLGEMLAFVAALLAVMRLVGDASAPWWPIVLGAAYLAVGAVPAGRWVRRPTVVGTCAFLVPLAIFGWIGWRIEYFLRSHHAGGWEDLPRVVLTPANLGIAAFLSVCAIAGHAIGRRVRRRAAARVVRQTPSRDRR